MSGKITKEELHTSLISFIESVGNSNNSGLTQEQVTDIINATVINGAPEALSTLKELATAINNDANFSDTIKAYTDSLTNGVIDNAPANLNTLKKIAAAINNDANFNSNITSAISKAKTSANTYADKVGEKYDTKIKNEYLPTNFMKYIKKDVIDFNDLTPGIFNVSTSSNPALNAPYDDGNSLYGVVVNIPRGGSIIQLYLDNKYMYMRFNLTKWIKVLDADSCILSGLESDSTAVVPKSNIDLGAKDRRFKIGHFSDSIFINNKRLSISNTAPSSPATGDVWIQV